MLHKYYYVNKNICVNQTQLAISLIKYYFINWIYVLIEQN